MNDFLIYEFKVALLIALFYVFWKLLVSKDTWHKLNRMVLLSTAIASFVLPLCVFTLHQTVEVTTVMAEHSADTSYLSPVSATGKDSLPTESFVLPCHSFPEVSFDYQFIFVIIYIIGVLVVLSRTLLSLYKLHKLETISEIHPLDNGVRIAVCDKVKSPYSWWKTIYMNSNDFAESTPMLLEHELGHIRLHHSADIIIVELITAMQWFNPTIWLLRADLRTVHEYEADQQVISNGFDEIQYLHLLINRTAIQNGYSLANGFCNSTLKNRISMITKPKSQPLQLLRLLYLLPIIIFSLAMSAQVKKEEVVKNTFTEESAIIFEHKDGKEWIGVKVPAGAFFTWLANGRLAERSIVKEGGWMNNRGKHYINEDIVTLDGQIINSSYHPYVPLSSIKEVKLIQGEKPRRIELYTKYTTEFNRKDNIDLPATYKGKAKTWMFFRAEDAKTGQQLANVELSIIGTSYKVKTNEEGWCEMNIPLGATVQACCPGYETEKHQFNHLKVNEVQGWGFFLNKSIIP